MAAVDELSPLLGRKAACETLGVPRASYYRALSPAQAQAADTPDQLKPHKPTKRSPRALSDAERDHILALVNSERFADLSPREIYATLLDEGVYVCSWPTIYRLLREKGQTTQRRDRPHRPYQRPELLAKAPRQLWSWDITKLKGPQTWTYFYLYVILDVFSRYVVGWMIAPRESAELAETLIGETCHREQIGRDELTIHADRGSSMRSKCVSQLLLTWGWHERTVDRTYRTTIRFRKHSSRRPNTTRVHQSDLEASKMRERGQARSSSGITTSTTTRGWDY
jgi:putative transposase